MTPLLTPLALATIQDVLASAGEDLAGELTATPVMGGRSNVTIKLCDGASRWVLRTPATSGRTPSAHDVLREHRVISALGASEVPVPRAVAAGDGESPLGVPFAIFEFVEGTTVQARDHLDSLHESQREQVIELLIETLAKLHLVDPASVGLGSLARPGSYGERQVGRWSSQWRIVGVRDLDTLAAEVAERLSATAPSVDAGAIVHGDFRIDNTILQLDADVQLRAVVDWELAAIGDPTADVAMMCAYRAEHFDHIIGTPTAWASPSLPSASELPAAYERSAREPLRHWTFHLALAYFKVAVIAASIDHRHRAAGNKERHSAIYAVEPYLTLARSALRGSA